MPQITWGHSHLFRGALRHVRGEIPQAPIGCVLDLHFADGALCRAHLQEGVLQVDPYRTRAGRSIPARAWRLTITPETGGGLARILGPVTT